VPPKNGVGCDDRRDPRQHPTTQTRAEGRQTSPVIVSQPQALMAQLRFQDAVLFAQVLMISCWSCWSQPRQDATKSCSGITARSLRQLLGAIFRTLRAHSVDQVIGEQRVDELGTGSRTL
jgi:hypothetical protein